MSIRGYTHQTIANQWSGFDIRYLPSRKFDQRMSNPSLHWKQYSLVVL